MQRARRFASTAVVATLAVSGLAACRSEPGVAAYLGDRQITVDRVDAVYTDARVKLDAALEKARAAQAGQAGAQPVPDTVALPISRQDVLITLVGQDLIKQYAQSKGVRPTAVDPASITQEMPLTPDAEFVVALAEYRGYVEALAQAAQPGDVTEADLTDVFERLRDAGALGQQGATATVQQWAGSLNPQQRQVLAQFIGLREDMEKSVGGFRATINPRFGPGELPLLPFNDAQSRLSALIVLPLTAAPKPAAVADVS
jgi:hypothetical protein